MAARKPRPAFNPLVDTPVVIRSLIKSPERRCSWSWSMSVCKDKGERESPLALATFHSHIMFPTKRYALANMSIMMERLRWDGIYQKPITVERKEA